MRHAGLTGTLCADSLICEWESFLSLLAVSTLVLTRQYCFCCIMHSPSLPLKWAAELMERDCIDIQSTLHSKIRQAEALRNHRYHPFLTFLLVFVDSKVPVLGPKLWPGDTQEGGLCRQLFPMQDQACDGRICLIICGEFCDLAI